ncbi:hypothetical protein [Paenibacillus beijingensis]|nr:hypothetical protein [Paenibacillus beijingensis]
MIKLAKKQDAKVSEKKPDCCTALDGRTNLVAHSSVMVAGC